MDGSIPHLSEGARKRLLAAVRRAGVDTAGKWLADAAVEAVQSVSEQRDRLRGRVKELEATLRDIIEMSENPILDLSRDIVSLAKTVLGEG